MRSSGSPGLARRVLLVTEASSAGVGRHFIDLARGLIELEYDVHMLYSPLRIDAPFERGIEALGREHATVVRMQRAPDPRDWSAHRRLLQCTHERGPFDVIHAHSSKAGLLTRATKGTAVQVYTPHCMYTMNPTAKWVMRRATLAAERLLARRADKIIAVSPAEEQHMLSIGIEQERIRVIPNGVEVPRWSGRSEVRAELGFLGSEVVVGFLGRLSDQKNPLMLIRAFAKCHAEHPNLRLCIVGDGPLEAETRRLAGELGVQSAVVWTGHRAPEDVLLGFDVFALPSRYEAMPYVLLEALAAGLPIVATPVGGVGDTVDEGQNGAVAKGLECGHFVRALTPVIEAESLRASYAAHSVAKSTAFTTAAMVQATHDLYGELAEARTRR